VNEGQLLLLVSWRWQKKILAKTICGFGSRQVKKDTMCGIFSRRPVPTPTWGKGLGELQCLATLAESLQPQTSVPQPPTSASAPCCMPHILFWKFRFYINWTPVTIAKWSKAWTVLAHFDAGIIGYRWCVCETVFNVWKLHKNKKRGQNLIIKLKNLCIDTSFFIHHRWADNWVC
jgi:hypothetical protein